MSSSPHGVQFTSHRPDIMGRNGMVASGIRWVPRQVSRFFSRAATQSTLP